MLNAGINVPSTSNVSTVPSGMTTENTPVPAVAAEPTEVTSVKTNLGFSVLGIAKAGTSPIQDV